MVVAALDRREVAAAFLAAVLGQLRVLPHALSVAPAAGLVALAPRVLAPNAVHCSKMDKCKVNIDLPTGMCIFKMLLNVFLTCQPSIWY